MSVRIREADEGLFDHEIHLCLPPRDSPEFAVFCGGVEKKRVWLKERLAELGSVAQIAYHDRQPIAFIEYVSAEHAPIPADEPEETALITCIYKPKYEEKGVGSALLEATLSRLRQLGVQHVKTLVGRNPEWINGRIFLRHGFQLERTFYKLGGTEPLDMLALSLGVTRAPAKEPATIRFESQSSDSLPVHVVHFRSGQCPFSQLVLDRLRKVVAKFDAKHVVLEVLDSWENCRLARECGAMSSALLVNGKMPFMGPPSERKIEEAVQKEIERTRVLG